MHRILLDDTDAAVHHFMEWQARLHAAEFAIDQFLRFDHANEFKQEARVSERTAYEILQKRFHTNEYVYLGVASRAEDAARARHNLRTFILNEAWRDLENRHPEERALEIFMGPEDYALRLKQRGRT